MSIFSKNCFVSLVRVVKMKCYHSWPSMKKIFVITQEKHDYPHRTKSFPRPCWQHLLVLFPLWSQYKTCRICADKLPAFVIKQLLHGPRYYKLHWTGIRFRKWRKDMNCALKTLRPQLVKERISTASCDAVWGNSDETVGRGWEVVPSFTIFTLHLRLG